MNYELLKIKSYKYWDLYGARSDLVNFGGPQSGSDSMNRDEGHIASIWPRRDSSKMGCSDGSPNSPNLTAHRIYLHENQCYLGRVFLLLREDAGVEDFLSICGEMREEFFEIGDAVKRALKTFFQPDRMNYAALSNTSPKIHVHLVPRYKEPREFDGIHFHDTRWGKNYAPYDRSFVLAEEPLSHIRDAIALEIGSSQ